MVLLGGPGSGKSTLGQFLAQIHRAALLERREPHLFEPQIHQIVREIHQLCGGEELPWPATPRYPFRVELNRFAKALSSKEPDRVESLEAYLLNLLARGGNITNEDFLEWMATYPILLILDGLDEVPASSNRDAVVKAVNDFLAAARQAGTDIFVVATSRQQGYAGEFAGEFVAMRHVLPLSTVRALQYVVRYANARFGATDPNRAEDVITKLRESAARHLTAQLMATPLQVTFMVTVVAARGDPGEDRWQLFESYYRTIYDRERQKAVPPYDIVISKQAPTIERLHHDIGFWLQYKGESEGGTAVSLPITQFERLVDAYLSELGHEGVEKEKMVKLITDAASNRLVFLTSRVAGELSFDVRSLQEYMAAECIMTGDPEVIKLRLRAIAPALYWRNVFLFAASKCFADAQSRHLQDSVHLLCEDLNGSDDPLLDVTKAGSELAIDILQSGAVSENPNHARSLARVGLGLLAQPQPYYELEGAVPFDQRLVTVYRKATDIVYKHELELRIGQADIGRAIASWPLLVRLIDSRVGWATELAEKRWPSGPSEQRAIIRQMPISLWRVQWLLQKIVEFLAAIPPEQSIDTLRIYRIVQGDFGYFSGLSEEAGEHFFSFVRMFSDLEQFRSPVRIVDEELGFQFSVVPAALGEQGQVLFEALARFPFHDAGWLPLVLASRFTKSPTNQTLAGILVDCADGGWASSDRLVLHMLPWPLAVCIGAAKSAQDLRTIAQQVENEELGNTNVWKDAEEHWRQRGFDLEYLVGLASPSLADILVAGHAPISVSDRSINTTRHCSDDALRRLFHAASSAKRDDIRMSLVWFLVRVSVENGGGIARCIEPSEFQALCEISSEYPWWAEACVAHPEESDLVNAWVRFFDWLGHSEILAPYYLSSSWIGSSIDDEAWSATFQKVFVGRSARIRYHSGVFRLLGRLASAGHVIDLIPGSLLQIDLFSNPRLKLAAILVRLTQSSTSREELEQLADEAAILLDLPAEAGADHLIFSTAERHLDRNIFMGQFLLRLRERMPPGVDQGVARCEALLRQLRQKRASDLQITGQVPNLRLPFLSP